MAELTVYLIRHARAAERGAKYPDDRLRPLVDKGLKQAKTLSKTFKSMNVRLDQLFCSPFTRTAQTAEPLKTQLQRGRTIQYLDSLASDQYPQLLIDVHERLKPKDRDIALVGHEPYLSEFTSLLLTGQAKVLSVNFKKGGMLTLRGSFEPAGMTLESYLVYGNYKHLIK